jgi:hypothetical protein
LVERDKINSFEGEEVEELTVKSEKLGVRKHF